MTEKTFEQYIKMPLKTLYKERVRLEAYQNRMEARHGFFALPVSMENLTAAIINKEGR